MPSPYVIGESLLVADPLASWRWKVGGDSRIVALTRSGDAFVERLDGHVWWLDTGAGTFEEVAASRGEFEEMMADPDAASRLFLGQVVDAFIQANGAFPSGKCLGFTQLPVLGGTYTLENRWLSPAVEHFDLTGDLHRQMRDLPDGAQVKMRIVP